MTMKRGFTIIELLVASALLGMLVTILTMIFNQSSIAWRIGTAGVADLQQVRMKLGMVQDELDNVLVVPESDTRKVVRTIGLWDKNNALRARAVTCNAVSDGAADLTLKYVTENDVFNKDLSGLRHTFPIGQGKGQSSFPVYMVNVMSGGPNNDIDDEEAIWSAPYDTDRW